MRFVYLGTCHSLQRSHSTGRMFRLRRVVALESTKEGETVPLEIDAEKGLAPISHGLGFNLVLALAFVFRAEIAVSAPSPNCDSDTKITLRPGSVIVAEGDSLTFGADNSEIKGPDGRPTGERVELSRLPYPVALEEILGNEIRVVNHGVGGYRSVDVLANWKSSPDRDLTIVMVGANDVFNFSHTPSTGISVTGYQVALGKIIDRAREVGRYVIVVEPPSVENEGVDRGIEPYRHASMSAALQRGVLGVSITGVFANVPKPWTDGIHLAPDGYRALAGRIACHLVVQK